ncbi:MAG: GAF domain-containing protein, partial [Ignavibacteriaceae bacterium]
ELCKAIRSDETLKDTPIVLLTSLSGPADVIEALKCGADNFIRKPYDEQHLLLRIDNILSNRKLRSSDKVQIGVELYLGGDKHFITAERQQILDLLISTYEQAVELCGTLKMREQQISRANAILRGIYQIAKGLNSAMTRQVVIEHVLDRALELPDVRAGWFSVYEGDSSFKLAGSRGLPPALQVPGSLEGDCLCRRKVLSGEIDRSMNITECERLKKAQGETFGLSSHVTIPLKSGNQLLGILNLVGTKQILFSDDDLSVLNGIGNQIGAALDRCRIHEHLEELVIERTADLTAEIIERNKAEESVKKLNRIYAVLSNINHAIVRIHNMDELYNEACRITVKEGGFLMAWIGMVNLQTNKVDIVASAGLIDDYLNKIDIDLNNKTKNHGPTGRSIQLGARYISNDIANDESMQPWREDALRLGYRSSASFPIKVFGILLGVLTLYSHEINSFNEAEIKLLDELAMDISFASEVAEKEQRRLQAEEALRHSYDLLNLTGQMAKVGGWELDLKTQALSWTEEVYRIHEIDPATRLNVTEGINFYAPEARLVISRAVQEGIDSGTPWDLELPLITAQGRHIWVRALGASERLDGRTIRLYGAFQDITERKQAEQELIKARDLAELSNKLKDSFIANMSHEIRTPLNGILGMTSIIKETFAQYASEEDEEYFNAIDSSSKRIIRTVDMILNYSRMQIGEFSADKELLNLPSIINNLISEYKPIAVKKSLELTFENKSGDENLTADVYCLTHAISNLIDNALKYTNKGYVNVVLYRDEKENLKLDVKDSGIGIAEDYLKRLFEPYSQEAIGYTRPYEGIGLGLSIVKKFLDLNSSSISVVSKKGEGTIFTIQFVKDISNNPVEIHPLGKRIIKSAEKRSTEKVKLGHQHNEEKKSLILIVEDDEINQNYLRLFLSKKYKTVVAASASEALEALKNNFIELILMDISIKGDMNGLELTTLIKKTPEYSSIPVIAVTAYAFSTDRQNSLDAGCDEYISKPFKIKELLDKVGNLINVNI